MAEETNKSTVSGQNENPETNVTAPGTTPVAEKDTSVSKEEQIQTLMTEIAKQKRAIDKLTSANADLTKKYRATLSEQELATQEKAEREAEREEQFKTLLRENQINKLEKYYLGLKWTPDEASKMATAEVDGDVEAKVRLMSAVDARKQKEFEAAWIKSRPDIAYGNNSRNVTKEQFDKMSLTERNELYRSNRELYESFIDRK